MPVESISNSDRSFNGHLPRSQANAAMLRTIARSEAAYDARKADMKDVKLVFIKSIQRKETRGRDRAWGFFHDDRSCPPIIS